MIHGKNCAQLVLCPAVNRDTERDATTKNVESVLVEHADVRTQRENMVVVVRNVAIGTTLLTANMRNVVPARAIRPVKNRSMYIRVRRFIQ
jgi:hypothetical protein